jgi:hypothetical protein
VRRQLAALFVMSVTFVGGFLGVASLAQAPSALAHDSCPIGENQESLISGGSSQGAHAGNTHGYWYNYLDSHGTHSLSENHCFSYQEHRTQVWNGSYWIDNGYAAVFSESGANRPSHSHGGGIHHIWNIGHTYWHAMSTYVVSAQGHNHGHNGDHDRYWDDQCFKWSNNNQAGSSGQYLQVAC